MVGPSRPMPDGPGLRRAGPRPTGPARHESPVIDDLASLPALTELHLGGSRLTAEGRARLRQVLPRVSID